MHKHTYIHMYVHTYKIMFCKHEATNPSTKFRKRCLSINSLKLPLYAHTH